MTNEEFDAPAAIEHHPCPTCDVPAGSACRTGAGKTAVKHHTRRLQLVPRVAEELHVLTRAVDILERVGIAAARSREYPH
ncbi:zinc finger domain-containing protein, partial [Streptomyces spectabilis]|uniref:zinc finger domain-containing protein n=1 Tax=Streptomyces spectabilis TaxID=68270 RepID=UPI00346AE438